MLTRNGWSDLTYETLQNFLDSYQRIDGKKDYAVFDCDGTLFYGDTSIGLFEDQIRFLNYVFSPDELDGILSMGDPKPIQGVPFETYIAPLAESYRHLFEKGYVSKDLQNFERSALWENDSVFQEFAYRMNEALILIYLCWGYGPSAYSVYSLWSGFALEEYRAMSRLSLKRHSLVDGVQKKILTDPKTGKSLPIEIGLHPIMEMKEFLEALESKGIDLYIVSASPSEIVKEALRLFSFPKGIKVLGVENELDGLGRIFPRMDIEGKPYPIKSGKAISIKNFIAPNYGGRGPLLVAGDSEGDVAMLTSFKDTRVSLFLSEEASKEACYIKSLALFQKERGLKNGDIAFLLQGKNPAEACLSGNQIEPIEPKVQGDMERLRNGLSFSKYLDELKQNDPFADYASFPGYCAF